MIKEQDFYDKVYLDIKFEMDYLLNDVNRLRSFTFLRYPNMNTNDYHATIVKNNGDSPKIVEVIETGGLISKLFNNNSENVLDIPESVRKTFATRIEVELTPSEKEDLDKAREIMRRHALGKASDLELVFAQNVFEFYEKKKQKARDAKAREVIKENKQINEIVNAIIAGIKELDTKVLAIYNKNLRSKNNTEENVKEYFEQIKREINRNKSWFETIQVSLDTIASNSPMYNDYLSSVKLACIRLNSIFSNYDKCATFEDFVKSMNKKFNSTRLHSNFSNCKNKSALTILRPSKNKDNDGGPEIN